MRVVTVVALTLLVGCGSVVESPAAADAVYAGLVAGEQQVFELSSSDGKPADPAVVFDHRCANTRFTHTLRERVVLRTDGTAERTMLFDRYADDRLLESDRMRAVGTWSRVPSSTDRYYGRGPSIVLSLTPDNAKVPPYRMQMRVLDGQALSTLSPVGGSCPGSPNDARHAEFVYTRR